MLRTRPLTPVFGAEVFDIDLRELDATRLYPEIRAAFETQSALLFRGQSLSEAEHIRLAQLFGPLEDREADEKPEDAPFEVFQVSNVTKAGAVRPADALETLDLIANQQWHTDSIFLPVPALANLLVSRVVPSSGGETELASTRAAWAEMPERLAAPMRDAAIWHSTAHSRRKLSAALASAPHITKWPPQRWRAIWRNPTTGAEALYIASHSFQIEGMSEAESAPLLEELIAFCTQPRYVYTHAWSAGDVLIWDERATLHRGRPWPLEEARSLSSICVSATTPDGLEDVRAASV